MSADDRIVYVLDDPTVAVLKARLVPSTDEAALTAFRAAAMEHWRRWTSFALDRREATFTFGVARGPAALAAVEAWLRGHPLVRRVRAERWERRPPVT
jgi:hypothetical protein